MLSLIEGPNCFLFGTTLILMVCSAVRVDRYESNSLLNHHSHSTMLMSADSFVGARPQVHHPFRYWSNEVEYQGEILGITQKGESYEIVLERKHPHTSHISPISYRIGTGSIWSEIFR